MAREKKYREPVNWKRELRLAPGYLILLLWITFTFVLLGWVLLASFSTTKEIFSNKLLASGLHFENYVKAWINSDVAGIFRNSLIYSIISCSLLIIICAPAAYVCLFYPSYAAAALSRVVCCGSLMVRRTYLYMQQCVVHDVSRR